MAAKQTLDALEKKIKALEKKVVQHKNVENKLKDALKLCKRHAMEVTALQQSCKAVLSYQEFDDVARAIFDRCKKLVGATSGYIALLDDEGAENKLLFLDAGTLPCNVDPALPMPVRGLRAEVYRTVKTTYENDFSNSEWVRYLPEGHVALQNVMFAPLVVDGRAVGLLGLANKPGGFSDKDAEITSGFSELATIALINSKALEERKRSEAALRESEERFRCITASAQNAIIMMNSQGNISHWNEAAEKIFGYTKSEILGKELHETLVPKKNRKSFSKGFETFRRTGKGAAIGRTLEFSALKKDGTEFPIEISLSAAKLRGEWCAVGILRDISNRKQAEQERQKAHIELERRVQERTAELTIANERLQREIEERKQAVAALRASKERFDLALYGSKDGLWDWDITSDRIYYSPRLKELLGYNEDSEPPETFDAWASGIHPKDYKRTMEALKNHLEHKKVYDVEYLFRKRTGEYCWQHSRGQAIFSNEGTPLRMVGFVSDVTERKKGEEALRKSEENYRLLVKNLPSIVYRGFKDWSVEFVDEKIESLTGYNREAFNSRRIKWSDLIIKEDFESARQSFLWALKTNKSYVREYRIKTRAGQIHWIQDRGQIICDQNGEVQYVSGVFFDINERKQTEDALRKSEKELRILSSLLLSAEETERKRIARELHDGIGQSLSAVKFSVENTIEELRKKSLYSNFESLESVIPLIQQTIEEVRRIVRDLRPSILDDLGILATIAWFCRDFQNIYSSIRIEKEITVKENEIPVSLKTPIFRVLQEAMNNIAKHSQADRVYLALKKIDDHLLLLVQDNGVGFDVEEIIFEKNSMRGFGLATMRERAEFSGGFFTIESSKGSGTTVRVLLPA